ncbi:MAG TPA: carbohydrate-binding family 9-like protein [Thermoanaerobaculia bacterium]
MTLESFELPRLDVPLLGATGRLVGLPPVFLRDARTGERPRLATALRVGLREDSLLVRFDGRDDGVVASLKRNHSPLWTEDVFEVFLSPVEPPSRYYEFEVNPLGAVWTGRVESPDLDRRTMRVESSWRCRGFSARVVVAAPRRWSAVLRVPLAPMVGGAVPYRWRANFYRIDRGSVDAYSAWSPTLAEPPDFHIPERFGFLTLPTRT